MIKKILPALWVVLFLVALCYVIRVHCFTPVAIPAPNYVVTSATEMVANPAPGSTDSKFPSTPSDAVPAE